MTHCSSLCEFDPWISAKICKCLSGFEEVKSAQNKLYCAPVKPTQSKSSLSSTAATVEQDEAAGGRDDEGKDDNNEDVVVFSESPATQEEHDAKMSETTDLKTLVLKLGKSNQIGLIVFAGVVLMALLLVALVIRLDLKHIKLPKNC